MPTYSQQKPKVQSQQGSMIARSLSPIPSEEQEKQNELMFKVSSTLAGGAHVKMDTMVLVRQIKALKDRQFLVQKISSFLAMVGLVLCIFVVLHSPKHTPNAVPTSASSHEAHSSHRRLFTTG